MLTLHFDSPSEAVLGPAHSFVVEGPFVRQAPQQEIVCRYANGRWRFKGEAANGFECRRSTLVQLEDVQGRASPIYGPFARLEFRARNCFADDMPFAEFMEKTERWKHRASGVTWRVMNVRPASQRQAHALLGVPP